MSRVFSALLLTLGPAAAIQACSDAVTSASTPIEDASAESDGFVAATDGKVDEDVVDAQLPPIDAVCTLVAEMRDAGPDADADADPGCRYVLPCGVPDGSGFHVEGCELYAGPSSQPDAALGCRVPEGLGCSADAYVPAANGSLTFDCLDCFGGAGRRPSGLLPPRARRAGARATGAGVAVASSSAVGMYFARMAYDEAASVHAFVGLEADLVRLGAPAELVDAAARAARDEQRHARMMARRARACGGGDGSGGGDGGGALLTEPRVRRRATRSLESIARENAVEGCVHETFGALQLRWQAEQARSAADRRLFARIAADETRHAALSWRIAAWAEARLDARARKRVEAARARATRALGEKLARSTTGDALDREVGRPSAREAVTLLEGLVKTLAAPTRAASA